MLFWCYSETCRMSGQFLSFEINITIKCKPYNLWDKYVRAHCETVGESKTERAGSLLKVHNVTYPGKPASNSVSIRHGVCQSGSLASHLSRISKSRREAELTSAEGT